MASGCCAMKKSPGFTLAEIFIASTCGLLLLAMGWVSLKGFLRSFETEKRISPEIESRALLLQRFRKDVALATGILAFSGAWKTSKNSLVMSLQGAAEESIVVYAEDPDEPGRLLRYTTSGGEETLGKSLKNIRMGTVKKGRFLAWISFEEEPKGLWFLAMSSRIPQ